MAVTLKLLFELYVLSRYSDSSDQRTNRYPGFGTAIYSIGMFLKYVPFQRNSRIVCEFICIFPLPAGDMLKETAIVPFKLNLLRICSLTYDTLLLAKFLSLSISPFQFPAEPGPSLSMPYHLRLYASFHLSDKLVYSRCSKGRI